jgi:WD40 repeat protein
MKESRGVFICYRREDAGGFAGRLHRDLARALQCEVFIDIDSIKGGDDFVAAISNRMARCSTVLVLVGTKWLTATDRRGSRRLDDPNDFVRQEIEESLRNPRLLVVPVLLDGVAFPDTKDLPDAIRPLARRNAVELTNKRWDYDVAELLKLLPEPSKRRWHVPALSAAAAVLGSTLIWFWAVNRPVRPPAGSDGTSAAAAGTTRGTSAEAVESPPAGSKAPPPAGAREPFVGPIAVNGGVSGIAFNPDGTHIATAGGNNHTLILWSALTGHQVRSFAGDSIVSAVAFSRDGKHVATDSTLYDVSTGERIASIGRGAYDVAFSPDGRFIATASGYSPSLGTRLYDQTTGQEIVQLSNEYASRTAFSHDGKLLAAATGYLRKGVRIWNVDDRALARTLEGPSDDVSFSPDGRFVATVGDGIVSLFRPATGEHLRNISGRSAVFSPDGRILAIIGEDRHVQLWDPSNGNPIRTLQDVYAKELVFSPDGERIVTLAPDNSVRIWKAR